MIRIAALPVLLLVSTVSAEEGLQQKIDAAAAGSTVQVAAGTYRQPLHIEKGITLKGEADAVLEITSNEPAILVDSYKPVMIEGITIRWKMESKPEKGQTPYAPYVRGGNVQVRDCKFVGGGTTQQSPCAAMATERAQMDLKDCRFHGFEYAIQYWDEAEGRVEDCLIMNPGHCGITIGGGSTGELIGNIVAGSRYHGIRCTGGRITARDNLVIRNRNRGFYLGNKSAVGTISNNLIVENAHGINAYARTKVSIENNVILKSSYAGISLSDTSQLTIQDNAICQNEKGIICFSEEKGKTPSGALGGQNLFFGNKLDAEHIRLPSKSLTADPQFKDPDAGDFSTDAKAGLKKPARISALWDKWQAALDQH